MKCENLFCIYFQDNLCLLDEISLDIQGGCRECIYITIDEKLLQQERKKILRWYEEQEVGWED